MGIFCYVIGSESPAKSSLKQVFRGIGQGICFKKSRSHAPNYLIVKSAGNDRGKGPEPGTSHYAWINEKWTLNTTVRDKNGGAYGYDCISHNGVSKNILSIGAATNTGAMTSFSSWGPTDDGRIKPDVVAKGASVTASPRPHAPT